MASKDIIFISCGQRSETEKRLGTEIAKLVNDLTPFEPYFAEYQTTLEGLTKHVFGALNRCAGLIVVLNHRGTVQPIGLMRASVWIEQEIAIAAFLQEIMGRRLHVAAFAERGLSREGVRETLLLNPKDFEANDDILNHLRSILPNWRPLAQTSEAIDISLEYTKKSIESNRHDYELLVLLHNRGTEAITAYQIDLEFPMELLNQPKTSVRFVEERSSRTVGFFRVTQDAHKKQVFPGDTLRVMSVEYFVDGHIFFERNDVLNRVARATLYRTGHSPLVVERPIGELQIF